MDNTATATLDRISPSFITLTKGAIAGSTNLAIGLATDGGPPAAIPLLAALAIGAVGYGASITLWVAGARDLGAARAQLVFATAPFIGAVSAWALLAEAATAGELAAFAAGLAGVALVLNSSHDHDHQHEPIEHSHEHSHDDNHHEHEHIRGDEGEDDGAGGVADRRRHTHRHTHHPVTHRHAHVPDLHHRHRH